MVIAAGPRSALKFRRRFLRSGLRYFRAGSNLQSAALPPHARCTMRDAKRWRSPAGGKKQYYLDQEIALYLLGGGNNGRYYDAVTGRFLSEDPTQQDGTSKDSNSQLPTPDSSSDANLYCYATLGREIDIGPGVIGSSAKANLFSLPLAPESHGTFGLAAKFENLPPSLLETYPGDFPAPSQPLRLVTGEEYTANRASATHGITVDQQTQHHPGMKRWKTLIVLFINRGNRRNIQTFHDIHEEIDQIPLRQPILRGRR